MSQHEPVARPDNPDAEANTAVDEQVAQDVVSLLARCKQAWRTSEGTYLVPQAFAPVRDSYGNSIVRADGTVLAVATTYAELTSTGEVLHVYGGPFRYYSPEETLINAIFDVVGGALHQYEWYEQERPAPGSLTDVVVREGLVTAAKGV